jgi:transcriptional regulator with XRE-family HTH domain
MGKSSIAKQLRAGAGSSAAVEIGRRLRERRIAAGLTQAELAAPLSRGFVSAVEKGRALPSLGALWLFAARLGTRVGSIVDEVNGIDTVAYTPLHGTRAAPEGAGRTGREEAPPDRR